jgi:hypothetical protein
VRVEPLLLEGQSEVKTIVASYDDADRIEAARAMVEEFVSSLDEGRCERSFEMLSLRYRSRMEAASGGADAARSEFCDGKRENGGRLEPCDWVELLVGKHPHHLITPPPDMGLESGPGEELFVVVQRDGSYKAFLLVSQGESRGIEPF